MGRYQILLLMSHSFLLAVEMAKAASLTGQPGRIHSMSGIQIGLKSAAVPHLRGKRLLHSAVKLPFPSDMAQHMSVGAKKLPMQCFDVIQ
jgi:hypothetical protein